MWEIYSNFQKKQKDDVPDLSLPSMFTFDLELSLQTKPYLKKGRVPPSCV